MDLFYFFVILAVILFIIFFFRDLFPKCPLCGKTGIRFLYRSYRAPLDYRPTPPVCKRCTRKYDIDSPSKYRKALEIKRKVWMKVKITKQFPGDR